MFKEDKLYWWLAEFDYYKDGKKYHYRNKIRAKCGDDVIDRVTYDLELEQLDSDYLINELAIKIKRLD